MCTASPGEVFPWCLWVGVILVGAAPGLVACNISMWMHSLCVLLLPQPMVGIRAVHMISEVSQGLKTPRSLVSRFY